MASSATALPPAVQEYWDLKTKLVRDLDVFIRKNGTRDKDGHRQLPQTYAYVDLVLQRLERDKIELATKALETRNLAVYDRTLWQQCRPLSTLSTVLREVLLALGTRMMSDELSQEYERCKIPKYLSEPEATLKMMQSLVQRATSVGMPHQMINSAIAQAATRLCVHWVNFHYKAYRGPEDQRRHESTSLMEMVKQDVLLHFCPVASLFAGLARAQPDGFASDLWPQHGPPPPGFKKCMSPGGTVTFEWIRGGPSQPDLRWQEFAMLLLSKIRSLQAWEIFHMADPVTKNHLLSDLAQLTTHPLGRQKINQGLQESFHQHLLNPGSATVDVLDEFMLIVRTLKTPLPSGQLVDATGVLLDLTAQSIRTFLRTRDDAARIVIQSLLDPQPGSNGTPPASTHAFSGRISMAMYHHANPHTTQRPFEGQDLLDMNWVPRPIDARATHGDNVSKDDIGHVTSIQDDATFIGELEEVLAERMLKTEHKHFRLEQRLLAMFKKRFDDETGDKTLIQRSETMLNDIMQSLEFSDKLAGSTHPLHLSDLQVRVVSVESWHNLKEREPCHFTMPMQQIQEAWELITSTFEESSEDERYLEVYKELGSVTIELELEDRTIKEDVTLSQASVLYGFSEDYDAATISRRRTIENLTTMLDMPESLVKESLAFWVGKMVIYQSDTDLETGQDVYAVRETLSADEEKQQATNVAHVQAELEQTAEASSHEERLQAHAEVFSGYIVGMLTNLGAMPAVTMHQHLSAVVPGGFTFDQNDLETLLANMAKNGEVEQEGIMWRARALDENEC